MKNNDVLEDVIGGKQESSSCPTRLTTFEDYSNYYGNCNRKEMIDKIMQLTSQCEYQNKHIELMEQDLGQSEKNLSEMQTAEIRLVTQLVEAHKVCREQDKRIAELEAQLLKAHKEITRQSVASKKVIDAQNVKIRNQAANISILLDMNLHNKRSREHRKLRKKYKALKARFIELKAME